MRKISRVALVLAIVLLPLAGLVACSHSTPAPAPVPVPVAPAPHSGPRTPVA